MSVTLCTDTNTNRSHKVGVSARHTKLTDADPTPVSIAEFAMFQNDHKRQDEYSDDEGNNGTPWRRAEGVTKDKEQGTGAWVFEPRADDLATVLPLMFGGSFTGGVLEPDWICDFFTLEVFVGISNFHFLNCRTTSASFTSSSTAPRLRCEWNLESIFFRKDAVFTPGLEQSLQQPFVHRNSTITIDGRVVDVDDINLTVNNALLTDLFYNSVKRTNLPHNGQVITFSHVSPFDIPADEALLDLGATSIAGQVQYTAAGGALSLTLDFPALHFNGETPSTPSGDAPVQNVIQWTARSLGSGGSLQKPVRITLDSAL